MALKIIDTTTSKVNKENLIIFIHGFIGGVDTWIRRDNQRSILDYIKEDEIIASKFDFAVFDYYTELISRFDNVKGIIKSLLGGNTSSSKNIDITNIAQILKSEIRYLSNPYNSIVLIGHSMGGLVAKSLIIENIKEKSAIPIELFISLAVPHKGSNLAVLGKIILGNPQVENLQPLSEKIDQLTREWLMHSNALPHTVYFQGKYDSIVPYTSSVGLDNRDLQIVYTDDDHFGIVKPQSKEDVIIRAIKHHLMYLLKSPNKENTPITINSKTSFRNQYYEQLWNSLNNLRAYFDSGMRNDIELNGKVNPQPVYNYINAVSESKLFIENTLFDMLCSLYEEIAKESNSKIAEPLIFYLENKQSLTSENVIKLETDVNEARTSIIYKIEEFMKSNKNRFV